MAKGFSQIFKVAKVLTPRRSALGQNVVLKGRKWATGPDMEDF